MWFRLITPSTNYWFSLGGIFLHWGIRNVSIKGWHSITGSWLNLVDIASTIIRDLWRLLDVKHFRPAQAQVTITRVGQVLEIRGKQLIALVRFSFYESNATATSSMSIFCWDLKPTVTGLPSRYPGECWVSSAILRLLARVDVVSLCALLLNTSSIILGLIDDSPIRC